MTGSQLPFHTVDVFTERRFAGNPLAIVERADDLTDAQMQTIAREFNLSETIFVRRPVDPANTVSVRIFFPTGEIPFAGHPTIGCAIHLATAAHPGDDDFSIRVVLEEVAGLVPVAVSRTAGKVRAQFTAPIIPFAGDGVLPTAKQLANALGVTRGQLDVPGHSIGLWQGGPSCVYTPIESADTLSRINIDTRELGLALGPAHADMIFCYARADSGADFTARMFAPAVGIPEDPATGSACAIFAAQLLASGELKAGTNRFSIRQGYDMGRPSDIGLEVDVNAGGIQAVRISGSSVPVSSGMLRVS